MKTTTSAGLCCAIMMMPHALLAEDMTLTHHFPESHFLVTDAANPLMECLTGNWDGALNISVFPSAQLHSGKNALDALKDGLADVSAVAVGYVSGSMPLTGIAMLPGLAEDSTSATRGLRKVLSDGGPIADEFAQVGIRPLTISLTSPYQMMTRGEPITSLEDFQGKTWRSAGGTMSVAITALGGAPAEMPGGDMYVALQRGAMDGTILSTIGVKPYNAQEVLNSISRNAQFGQFATIYSMRNGFYEGLSDTNKAVVDDCTLKVETALSAGEDARNLRDLQEFEAGGITIYDLSPETHKAFSDALAPVVEEYLARVEERGLPAREAFDQLTAAINE